jgi:hypothetical protein
MSVRRIALVASLVAVSLSLAASPLLAAAPPVVTPDVGVRMTHTSPDSVEVSPWVWEPESSDSLRIAVGTRARRIVIRVWLGSGEQHGRFIEQRRVAGHWRTVDRSQLSAADLAGGSTDPARTRYSRSGFLAFDAGTLGVEAHGGLGYSVVTAPGRPLSVRFGARDQRTGRWTTVGRIVNR